MKNTKALAHIRQLCGLGVESHAVMPALMHALHDLIPSSNNLFVWTDAEGQVVDRYCEVHLPAVIEAARQDLPGKTDVPALARSGAAVGNLRQRPSSFYRSPYYAEVYRPMRARHSLDAVVRTARGTEGVLILHRDSDTAFSDEEAGELAAVLPYIRQLWTKPPGPASEVFNDTEGHGTLVCDSDGHIRHGSRNAAQLLAMAQRQGAMSCSGGNKQLPPELMGLQQRLLTLDTPGAHAGPPVLYVNNRWGRFVFRASWLEGVGHGATPLVAIGITRQEPLAVSVVRGLQSSPLSPKQRDVALMLVTGRSAEDIVKELSISVTTYKDHLRKIYEKLGISKRVDLIHHLTQPTPTP